MNNLKWLSLLLGTGICASVSLPAQAADVMYHGNFCNPVRADIGKIEHGSQYGVHNESATTATVQCPFNPTFFSKINRVDVLVYDRNPNTNVVCTLYGVDFAGTALWQISKSSSGSSAFWQNLVFQPNQIAHTVNMRCSIPGVTNSGYSHVTTYRVMTP